MLSKKARLNKNVSMHRRLLRNDENIDISIILRNTTRKREQLKKLRINAEKLGQNDYIVCEAL